MTRRQVKPTKKNEIHSMKMLHERLQKMIWPLNHIAELAAPMDAQMIALDMKLGLNGGEITVT